MSVLLHPSKEKPLQWGQALLQSEHVSIPVLISFCLIGNERQCESGEGPLGRCSPLPCSWHQVLPRVKRYLWRAQTATSPLGLHKRLQPPRPVSMRFLSSEKAVYNELVLSEIEHSLFGSRREVQRLTPCSSVWGQKCPVDLSQCLL